LGGKAVLSKLGLIKKMRNGKMEKRIILDLKESSVTASSSRSNRVVLPRATDQIQNLLEELDVMYDDGDPVVDDVNDFTGMPGLVDDGPWDDDAKPAMGDDDDEEFDLEQFVLDYTDSFWQVPLHPKERRFFVGKIRGIILSYLRASQGSRNGPLN
jgi:hypothetical protein